MLSKNQMVQRRAFSKIHKVSLCSILAFLVSMPAFACEWDYSIWMIRSKNADPLYRFVHDGKAGYIDRTGKVVIKPQLEAYSNIGGEFYDSLLRIGDEYVDSRGRRRKFKYSTSWGFAEGLAVAWDELNSRWGYINTRGKFVRLPHFSSYSDAIPSSFSEGLARVEIKGQYGYIDRKGYFAINPAFLWGDDFHDGMARVIIEGPCQYNLHNDGPCSEWSVVPREVKEKKGDKYGYVNHSGSMVIVPQFEDAEDFSDGLAPVGSYNSAEPDKSDYIYINKEGKPAFDGHYIDATHYYKGLAHVRLKPKATQKKQKSRDFAYINTKGKIVFRYTVADK